MWWINKKDKIKHLNENYKLLIDRIEMTSQHIGRISETFINEIAKIDRRIIALEKEKWDSLICEKKRIDVHNNSIEELYRSIDLYFDEIKQLNQRLNILEANTPKIVLYKSDYKSDVEESEYSTTGAIIDLLTKNKGKKLHYSNIYDMIKDYNLINKNVSLPSVKATLYGLARQNKISLCDGKKGGMFFIEQKKGN